MDSNSAPLTNWLRDETLDKQFLALVQVQGLIHRLAFEIVPASQLRAHCRCEHYLLLFLLFPPLFSPYVNMCCILYFEK